MERLPEDLQIYIFEIVQKLKMENVLKDIKKMNIPYDSTDEDDEKKHTTLWVNNEYLEEHRIFLLSNWAVSVDLWRPHIYTDKKYIIYKNCIDDDDNIVDEIFKEPIKGNTWLDLYFAANKLIVKSGDYYHNFIESFDEYDNECIMISTGS